MRLDDLMAKLMDKGGPAERNPRRFAEDSGGYLSRARVDSWTRVRPEDIFTTPWGTQATMANSIDPDKIVGIAIAGHVPDLTVLRAVGQSMGLRNMWTGTDDTLSLLHAGLHELHPHRLARVNDVIDDLAEEQARERRIAELEAENAALREQAQTTEPARTTTRRR